MLDWLMVVCKNRPGQNTVIYKWMWCDWPVYSKLRESWEKDCGVWSEPRGGATSKRKAKAGLPQGMSIGIQSKRQLVTWKCDFSGRKWLICNINRLFIHSLKCFATIQCDCSWYINYYIFLRFRVLITVCGQQSLNKTFNNTLTFAWNKSREDFFATHYATEPQWLWAIYQR